MDKAAARGIVEQFKEIQRDLDELRAPTGAVTPSLSSSKTVAARVGQLVLLEPPADGVLVTIPQGNADNITKRITIAVIGGTLTPGVSVSIVGRRGTINGQQVLNINSYRLVELVSCGAPGWFFST